MAYGYYTVPFWHSESPPGPSWDPLDLQKLWAHHNPYWWNHGPMEPNALLHLAGKKWKEQEIRGGEEQINLCQEVVLMLSYPSGWVWISVIPLPGTIMRLLSTICLDYFHKIGRLSLFEPPQVFFKFVWNSLTRSKLTNGMQNKCVCTHVKYVHFYTVHSP